MENLNRIFEVMAETNSVENTPEIALSEEFSNMAEKMKSLPELTCCHKEINNSTIELMFKTSVSDTCVKYSVPYEGKIWKVIQQHASDLGITFKKDVEANGFYILINGHYHLKRSILNSSPKELGLKHGDIITVDDEKSFGEWAHLNAIRSIEYIPHYTVWGTLDYLETEDNDIQIVIVNESEYRLAPYDIRCTAIVYPETTLGEIEETFGSNLNLAGKKGDLYFRIENKIYHDSKTTMAEMKIKTGDIIYVFPTPYNAYYLETIWPDDTFF